jgi:iron complex outermembrane receptor protein
MSTFSRRSRALAIACASVFASAGGAAAELDSTQPVQLEEIIVTSVRESLDNALKAKRDGDTILDSISAEGLGKFPSRNVADALGNVAGVVVQRTSTAMGNMATTSGGEGQFVTIRGLGEDFSIVTLNGRILATDNVGRQFAFDVLPSEMISGADVFKAARAQNLEGSIGGAVDLRSARPFDYAGEGLQVFGSSDGEYTDLADDWGKRVSGVVSNTFLDDRVGALLSVSWSKRKVRTDNLHEYSATSDSEASWNTDINGNGAIDEDDAHYIWPHFYSVGTISGEFERLGLTTALQFQVADNFALTLDGLYTRYDSSTNNYAASFHLDPREDQADTSDEGAKWVPGTVRLNPNGVVTGFGINDLVAEVLDDENPRVVKTTMFGVNAAWDVSDRLHLIGDAYLSEAKRDSGGQSRFVVAGIPGSSGVFSTNGAGLPNLAVTIPGDRTLAQATDDDYDVHYIGIQGDNLRDRVASGKLDARLDMESGALSDVKFGAAYTSRDKSDTVVDNANTTSCNYCGYPFSFGAIDADVVRPLPVTHLLRDISGGFPRNFASFDINAYLASLRRADNNPAIVDPNTGEPYPTGYSQQVLETDLPLSFDVEEKTTAAYVQADFKGERWRADLGLRYVHTATDSTGHSIEILSITKRPGNQADYDVELSEPTPVSGGGSYSKLLPSANFSFDIRPDLRVRLAASEVIARPSLDELSSASDATSAASGDFVIFNAGNPQLKPTQADQYDISLEWYLSPQSMLSAAVFYKDISDFVTTVTTQQVIQGQDFSVVNVVNGDDAKVTGAEIAGQFIFDNGFGVVANVASTSSDAHLGGVSGDLEGVIPHSYSLKLLYEKYGWSNQVSYSYASRYTSVLSGMIEGVPVYTDAYKDLSATISYNFGQRYTVFVEGSNLLNETQYAYNVFRDVPALYQESGRFYFVGLRARL